MMSYRVGRRSRRNFLTDFEIFRRRVDDVVIYFFNSDFKFFNDALEFSVTSFDVVLFLFYLQRSCYFFLLYNKSSVVAEMGDRLARIDMGRREEGLLCAFPGGASIWNGGRPRPRRHCVKGTLRHRLSHGYFSFIAKCTSN